MRLFRGLRGALSSSIMPVSKGEKFKIGMEGVTWMIYRFDRLITMQITNTIFSDRFKCRVIFDADI